MVRKNLLIGAALAAALLAGCSGTSNNGNASAETTTSSATASSAAGTDPATTATATSTSSGSTAASTSDAGTEASTDDGSAADGTGSVQPAALDDQSRVWFGTLCTGLTGAFTGMMGAMGGAQTTGGGSDPKAAQAAMVSSYQQVATAFSDTASDLSGLPAPTVAGGDQIARDLPAALSALSEGFATATEKFAAAEVTDEASLSAAMDALNAETERYGTQLETQFSGMDATLTPEIVAAVQALPECAMMSS